MKRLVFMLSLTLVCVAGIALALDMPGIVMRGGSNMAALPSLNVVGDAEVLGTIHAGEDDDKGDIEIHHAGTLKFWDSSDDTSVTFGPVGNGTTVLGITGTLNATGLQVGGAAVSTASSSDTLTNKTYDASGAGNVFKKFNYLVLANPHMVGAGVAAGIDTTGTNEYYGQAKFDDATDEATNYVEYRLVVPYDIDTTVDLVAYFKFRLAGADTGDHDYVISQSSVADSGDYTGSLGQPINLAYTADASGADGDVETATGTLTDWKSNVTAGQLWVIRVARDGNDGVNDDSTVDSYTGALVIKYGITQ